MRRRLLLLLLLLAVVTPLLKVQLLLLMLRKLRWPGRRGKAMLLLRYSIPACVNLLGDVWLRLVLAVDDLGLGVRLRGRRLGLQKWKCQWATLRLCICLSWPSLPLLLQRTIPPLGLHRVDRLRSLASKLLGNGCRLVL